jgi:hypothetical protein
MNEAYVCQRLRQEIIKEGAGYPMRHNGLTMIGCPDLSVTGAETWWLEVKLCRAGETVEALINRIIRRQGQQLAVAELLDAWGDRCRYVIAVQKNSRIDNVVVARPRQLRQIGNGSTRIDIPAESITPGRAYGSLRAVARAIKERAL